MWNRLINPKPISARRNAFHDIFKLFLFVSYTPHQASPHQRINPKIQTPTQKLAKKELKLDLQGIEPQRGSQYLIFLIIE